VDLEPVVGEAADPDDVLAGQVAAAAADCDGLTVADGAGELPPLQVDGIGIAVGEQAEHAGNRFPRSASATCPVTVRSLAWTG
jgi:hypothetical protein